MTCVIGLVEDGTVWIGADSAGVADHNLVVRRDPKNWASDGWAYGFTSSFRMGQLIRHSFVPPERGVAQSVEAYMVGPFVDALRRTFKDGGFARTSNEKEEAGTFLVGHNGRLYVIESDYQVGEWAHPFAAVGSGAQVALGAMAVSASMKPEPRIKAALQAAQEFTSTVRGPFAVVRAQHAQG